MLNWLFYLIFYCTVLWWIPSSYAFHLLQDYFTVLKWKWFFSQRFIAELYVCICNLIYVYHNRYWTAKIILLIFNLQKIFFVTVLLISVLTGQEIHLCIWIVCKHLQFFSTAYTKLLLVTQFLKADTQTAEAHTKSAKPYTNSPPLTRWRFQFHKTLFAKRNTEFSM